LSNITSSLPKEVSLIPLDSNEDTFRILSVITCYLQKAQVCGWQGVGVSSFSSWVCLVFVVVVRNEMGLLEENSAKLKLLGDISVASLL
jgi:hypothetical protein